MSVKLLWWWFLLPVIERNRLLCAFAGRVDVVFHRPLPPIGCGRRLKELSFNLFTLSFSDWRILVYACFLLIFA